MPSDDGKVNLRRLFNQMAADATAPVPDSIESRLRLAFRNRQQRLVRQRLLTISIGLAACLLLTFAWSFRQHAHQQMLPLDAYAGFMALPYSQTDVPMEQAVIVRMDMQPVDLERLGLPAAFMAGKKNVQADLLIGQDGVARAVRLTQQTRLR